LTEKSETPERVVLLRGFAVLRAFLRGVLEDAVFNGWFFVVKFVVFCVVDVVI
jgi:hypothetical protein